MRATKSKRAPAPVRATAVCAAILLSAIVLSCTPSRDADSFFTPDDVGALVVDAVLIVGKPMPRVTVTRALSPGVAYSLEAAGEVGATVEVEELPNGPVFRYAASGKPGVYVPDAASTIKPNTTYTLRVATSAGQVVRAETTTPPAFAVDQWLLLDDSGENVLREFATFEALGDNVYFAPANQVVYADGLLEARFERPDVVTFQIGVFSLDLESDFVIEPEFFEQDDFDAIDRQGSSPALEVLDGKLRLPWFTIFFEGRYKIRVLALDANASDWVRSLPQDDSGFSFGGTLGDNFERPLFHVDGGIGLFGSASTDSIGFFVHPRP